MTITIALFENMYSHFSAARAEVGHRLSGRGQGSNIFYKGLIDLKADNHKAYKIRLKVS